jgi:ATP-dependent exoDNAse (exonuclease V) beta subunit
MLQRAGPDGGNVATVTRDTALRMLRPEEIAATSADRTANELADEAVDAYRALGGRPEIRAVYMAGDRLHEVPFAMRFEGAVLRGTIDCLVRDGSGRITVLEFKTGSPREEHRVQLDFYRRAAEQIFPGATIDARLEYANRQGSSSLAAAPAPGRDRK